MPRTVVQARPPQPLPPRHVPQRSCIACRTVRAKRDLIRIVRTPAGQVAVDLTGKKAGRGAYLHQNPDCWKEGLRKGRLARALHTVIPTDDLAALEEFMTSVLTTLPQERSALKTQHGRDAIAPKEATNDTENNSKETRILR